MACRKFIYLKITTFVLSSFVFNCSCAPLLKTITTRQVNDNNDNVLSTRSLSLSCDPITGRCWDLLPSNVVDSRDNYIVEQNSFLDRGSTKNSSRHAKKDMFMSRGWGAGGMPFSVLYMKPRSNHSSFSGSPTPDRSNSSNNRLALKNNNNNAGQPRRHYSIIPQLFISYGWGPSGK